MEQLKQHLHTGGREGEGKGRGGESGGPLYTLDLHWTSRYTVYMEKVTFSSSKLQTVSTHVHVHNIYVSHTHTHGGVG